MKKCISTIWSLIFFTSALSAQDKPIVYEADDEITWAGVDRAGDLLIVLKSGEVQKINKEGKKLGSHKFSAPPTLLDPLDGAQAFHFSRQEKVYGALSSDLANATSIALNPAFAISPWLVAPALHELWILDASDFSLKKTKLRSTAIAFETSIKHLPEAQIEDFISLREYQNYIFILDKGSGIHVFNNLGKYLKTLGERNISYFSFIGEELYYLKGNELVLIDLYTDEQRKLHVPMECQFAFLLDENLFAINRRRVTVIGFKP